MLLSACIHCIFQNLCYILPKPTFFKGSDGMFVRYLMYRVFTRYLYIYICCVSICCGCLRFQVKVDVWQRKFLKSNFPRDSDARTAAVTFARKAVEMLEFFDNAKKKQAILTK